MYYKLVTAMIFILPYSTASRILVTEEQCGRSFDLTDENELYLDYEGAVLGDVLSPPCVINVGNNNTGDMLCIRNENEALFDMDCAMILSYFIGGYKSYTSGKSCYDFSGKTYCHRNGVSSVVYRYTNLNRDAVHVRVFTKKYIPTTTSRYTPSPWSSWSSGYDDDDDDESSSSTGMLVGVIVGVVIALVLIIVCVGALARKDSAPKPIYGSPAVVHYQAQAQQGIQNSNQAQNFPNSATGPQQYQPNSVQPYQQHTQDPSVYAGYQIHAPVCQNIPVQDTGTGLQPTCPSSKSLSDPPPPYPGY